MNEDAAQGEKRRQRVKAGGLRQQTRTQSETVGDDVSDLVCRWGDNDFVRGALYHYEAGRRKRKLVKVFVVMMRSCECKRGVGERGRELSRSIRLK
jgi:hypothetical protein